MFRRKVNFKNTLLLIACLVTVSSVVGLVYLDYNIRQTFSGKKWRLPSHAYARPLELFEGKHLSKRNFLRELAETSYKQVKELTAPGQYIDNGSQIKIYRRAFRFWDEATVEATLEIHIERDKVKLLKVEGERVPLLRLEPMLIGGIYPHNFEDRKLVRLQDVPGVLTDALIAVEDQSFYQHNGISLRGIARAMYANVKAGKVVQGASTLTQQLVKNFYLSSERSLKRKLLEVIYSLLLELHYGKDEILETYLNEVYMAQDGPRAIHGFGLASEFYFGKSVSSLSIGEAASLAAIVNGPSHFNPRRYPDRCRRRRDKVLSMLKASGKISELEFLAATREPLGVSKYKRKRKASYPAFMDLLKRHLARDYDNETLRGEGYRIFTTFDPHIQWATEKSVAGTPLSNKPKLEAAAVVMGMSGDIEAVVGSRSPGQLGFNRALDSRRPIGSLIKPVIIAAALESGRYQLSSQVSDETIEVSMENGTKWIPKNYDGQSHGDVSLYDALIHSYNHAMVRLGLDIGVEQVVHALHKLGIKRDIPKNPAMLLGSLGMSPLEVATVYQALASQSYFHPGGRSIRYVTNSRHEILTANPVVLEKGLSESSLHATQFSMLGVMYEGTGRWAGNLLGDQLRAAGKTGTSNGMRDSWFAGFTGDKLAVVWLGYDSYKSTRLSGTSGALPIWFRLMKRVAREPFGFPKPPSIEYHWIDEETGKATFSFCQGARKFPFTNQVEPSGVAPCIKSIDPVLDWFRRQFN